MKKMLMFAALALLGCADLPVQPADPQKKTDAIAQWSGTTMNASKDLRPGVVLRSSANDGRDEAHDRERSRDIPATRT